MSAIARAVTRAFVCAAALGFGGSAAAAAGDAVPLGPDTVEPINVEVAIGAGTEGHFANLRVTR